MGETGHLGVFRRRRERFLNELAKDGDDAVAVFPSAPVYVRNQDTEHEYRQDSDFHYLTGFAEPESVLVLSARDRKTTLFVRPRDPERETWDGPRAGIDGAKGDFGADDALLVGDLDAELPKLLANHRRLYYRFGLDEAFDRRVLGILTRGRARPRLNVAWPTTIVDSGVVTHEMRLFKTEEEIASMRKAAAITKEAHERAMAAAKPGMHEYQVESVLLETFRRHGSERVAYGSIVGSGPNATILHYRSNDRRMSEGDLLLIDAGCELDYYASDVTRTFPVSGTFSKEQRQVYEVVLEAQLAGIALARPGSTLDAIHAKCVDVLTAGMVRLGLLAGEPASLVRDEAYRAFYMHRTSHWLGMDVHDVGGYFAYGAARVLEPGMVLTVEPGIYVAKDNAKVAAPFRGIGVRIEDDILVTEDGPVNLTQGIPKTVEEVERACAASP